MGGNAQKLLHDRLVRHLAAGVLGGDGRTPATRLGAVGVGEMPKAARPDDLLDGGLAMDTIHRALSSGALVWMERALVR